jgi:hypothetical protein
MSAHRPRVVDGRARKKRNWDSDRGDYHAWSQAEIRLDRRDPGPGRRHLLTIALLREFLALLPVWDEVAVGLDAIVLDSAIDCMGWHYMGVVAICSWPRQLWTPADRDWIDDCSELLERLEVEHDGEILRWTEPQARAFQLLDVLPHELGHHHDRITTASQRESSRGEPYAGAYARRVQDEVWPAFTARFGI